MESDGIPPAVLRHAYEFLRDIVSAQIEGRALDRREVWDDETVAAFVCVSREMMSQLVNAVAFAKGFELSHAWLGTQAAFEAQLLDIELKSTLRAVE